MSRTQPMTVVDAFANVPFRGNPAAVCVLEEFHEDALLQAIAQEMNLSETAFLVRRAANRFDLRWFTPSVEVDLCGHATLASAHALRETGHVTGSDPIIFSTRSGELSARFREALIELDFPAQPGTPAPMTGSVKQCLSVPILACESNGINLLVEVENLSALNECGVQLSAIAELNAQGLIVTTAGDCEPYDFASRYFAPRVGVAEDPVCGSAHCMLAPYWAQKLDKRNFTALQASSRRGTLFLQLEEARVYIAGTAVTTLRGTLTF